MTRSYRIRELDPAHIDKLIQLKGIVIRTSDVKPEMKEACFMCQACGKEEYKYIERGKITEPEECTGCGKKTHLRDDPQSLHVRRQTAYQNARDT